MDNNFDLRTRFRVEIVSPKFKCNKKNLKYKRAYNLAQKALRKNKNLKYKRAYNLAQKALRKNKNYPEFYAKLEDCIRSFGFAGFSGYGWNITISGEIPRIIGKEKHTCGSRIQQGRQEDEHVDTWDMRGDDPCCSYCGSLHPDRVLELVKENGSQIIEPSTKSYKWYINQPHVKNAGFGGIKYYRWHDTREFIDELNKLNNASSS